MTRQFVQQMADGDSVDEVYLVVDKQVLRNRNGNNYLQLELRDRSGAIGPVSGTLPSRSFALSMPGISFSSRARCSFSRRLANDPQPH